MASIGAKYVQCSGGCVIAREQAEMPNIQRDNSVHSFWVTNTSVDFQNSLQCLDYDEKTLGISVSQLWGTEMKTTAIADITRILSKGSSSLLVAMNRDSQNVLNWFSLTPDEQLELVYSLEIFNSASSIAVPCHVGESLRILVVSMTDARLFDHQEAALKETKCMTSPQCRVCCAGFDPHNCNLFATGSSDSLSLWDIRQLDKPASQLGLACGARTFDFNPVVPHNLILGSADGSVSVWDLRHVSRPLRRLGATHLHAVTATKFNPSHDQLVVTAGADGSAKLWRLDHQLKEPNVAEKKTSALSASRQAGKWLEVLLKSVDDKSGGHEDGVVGVVWSSSDPWTFASLSSDGVLLFTSVTEDEKYRILLS